MFISKYISIICLYQVWKTLGYYLFGYSLLVDIWLEYFKSMQNIKRSFLVANVFLACNNKSGTAANCGVAVMMVFHTKFNQN